MNTKEELRNHYRNLRSKLSPEERDNASLSIANQLLKLPIWEYTYYHIFLQIAEQMEVDTSYILTLLHGRDKDVVVPRVNKGRTLDHILLTDSTRLRKNSWNIPEPVGGLQVPPGEIDVVFVPLLAFDEQGHRIGYGGGFYDRFLADCREDTVKIGLSFFAPLASIEGRETHDIALDYGVTPDRTYSFSP